MFRVAGLDLGHTETRAVSVGLLWGSPLKLASTPNLKSPVVSMPADLLTIRTVNVPNSDRTIQGSVIREELRLSLPFSIDEASWDWIVKEENAAVAVALNSQLSQFREERQLPNEAVVDAEPFAYLRLCIEAKIDEALIFDFGFSKTTVCAIKDGALCWVKVSFRGGRSLTKEIAAAEKISDSEAETRKLTVGLDAPQCQQWLRDIVSASLLTSPVPFDKVFICGGGAQMKGLANELSDLLGQTVEPIPMPAGLSPYTDAVAYGTALAGKPGLPSIQLIHKVEEDSIPWKYAVWLVVLLALATCSLEIHHYTAVKSLEQQVAIYEEAASQVLPELVRQSPEDYQSTLNKLTEANVANKRSSPEYILELMAQMARPLSRQPSFEIRGLEFSSEKSAPTMMIKGQARSVQQVEEFRQGIEGILQKPEIIENKKGRQTTVSFSIEGEVPAP
ncbi:MAG: pilus assembly protein PilM [Candidatus Bruticola sp.]